jgi:hypothetical protein
MLHRIPQSLIAKRQKSWETPGSFTFRESTIHLRTTPAFFHATGFTGIDTLRGFPYTLF